MIAGSNANFWKDRAEKQPSRRLAESLAALTS